MSGALIVSVLIAFSYPYIVLKLGMGPNVSVIAAFLGALFLSVFASRTRGQNAVQNNIIQTAATAATSTAFMCVVAAAFGYLSINESVDIKLTISPMQMFVWLTCSGTLGVLVASLFRRHFINDPNMVFADGVAAAETIKVLDDTGADGSGKLKTLGFGAGIGMLMAFLRDGLGKISYIPIAMRYAVGIEWNVLSMGTGLIISVNVGLSMLLGTLVVWMFGGNIIDLAGMNIVQQSVAPQYWADVFALIQSGMPITPEQAQFLTDHGGLAFSYMRGSYFSILLMWFMWPATALMISAMLTAILLQWRSIARMFSELSTGGTGKTDDESEVSPATALTLIVLLTITLSLIQKVSFGLDMWMTFVSVIISFVLVLVGVRVLGETNLGPVSAMANAAQAGFRILSSHIGFNLIAAGMAGDINAQGEGTMQIFRTGRILGSTPRILTWVAFCAIPIGAAAVAIMYPLLIGRYGLGGEGLTAPTGLKLANMAVLLGKGISALPPGALNWMVIASIAGVVLAILRSRGWSWLPSAGGFGFSMILPGLLNLPIAIGSIVGWIWKQIDHDSWKRHHITVASGFIGGEALIAGLLLPILFFFGIL